LAAAKRPIQTRAFSKFNKFPLRNASMDIHWCHDALGGLRIEANIHVDSVICSNRALFPGRGCKNTLHGGFFGKLDET